MITLSIIFGLLFHTPGVPAGDFPNPDVYQAAFIGYNKLEKNSKAGSGRMVIIDYSKPSTEKRLYIVDMNKGTVLLETYVAHGKNSGELMATSFSNKANSNKSSIGFFRISENYHGKHGASYRLDGLEPGFNDKARERAIVIHAAWYANPQIASQQGRLGRSLGCPALPEKIYPEFRKLIDPGTLLFVYYPDEEYFTRSAVFDHMDRQHFARVAE